MWRYVVANEHASEENGLPPWWADWSPSSGGIEDLPTLSPGEIDRGAPALRAAHADEVTGETSGSRTTKPRLAASASHPPLATSGADGRRPAAVSTPRPDPAVEFTVPAPRRRSPRVVLASGILLVAVAVLLLLSIGGLGRAGALGGLPFFRPSPRSRLLSASGGAALATVRGASIPQTSTPASSTPNSHQGPVSYPIAALSPSLATYLQGQGAVVGVSIYDLTRNRVYGYNDDTQFLMGSSAKIPIMLEYFQYIESQGESPSADDESILSAMIEHSDNDAAQDLYSEFSYDAGLSQYLTHVGDPDFTSSPDGFGWFAIAPRDMVHLLTEFYEGKLTNSSDRALGLSLMENIEPDQRHGVGATAPKGTTFAMKDGWIIAPDGLWAANSSGIVMTTGETYIISVYTQDYSSLDSAFDVLDTVCGQSATSLLPHVAGAVSG